MFGSLLRQLPNFKGKRRLIRYLNSSLFETGKNVEIKGKYGLSYLLPNLKESISVDIFTNGIYEPETNDFLVQRIAKNGVILDLGANIGSIIIPLLKRRPDINAICVEAAPWIFEILKSNVKRNTGFGKIELVNKALHDKSGEILSFYSPGEQFGKGSLSPVFTKEAINVQSITIVDLLTEYKLEKVDFIKIDIEGFEYNAFKGAESILSGSDAPDILFEFVDWAEEQAGLPKGNAQRYLLDLGYKIYKVDASGQLKELDSVLEKGYEMLFASRK